MDNFLWLALGLGVTMLIGWLDLYVIDRIRNLK